MVSKISFVIPAYNEEENIAKCLESVLTEIKNTKKIETEIIVVNNKSTDKTKEIASGFKEVKVIDENRKGLVWARQAGFENSTGELIANIDSDTILPTGWLETVIKKFNENENLVALSGPFIYYDLPKFKKTLVKIFYFLGYIIHLANHHIFKKGAMLQGGNFVLKRSALEKMGGYDTTIEFYGEDTDVARRISKHGKVLWTFELPIYTSGRRIINEGMLRTSLKYTVNFFWISIFRVPYTKKYTDIRKNQILKN